LKIKNAVVLVWGYGSVVECLSSRCKALGKEEGRGAGREEEGREEGGGRERERREEGTEEAGWLLFLG
jgi:hypothetical protein